MYFHNIATTRLTQKRELMGGIIRDFFELKKLPRDRCRNPFHYPDVYAVEFYRTKESRRTERRVGTSFPVLVADELRKHESLREALMIAGENRFYSDKPGYDAFVFVVPEREVPVLSNALVQVSRKLRIRKGSYRAIYGRRAINELVGTMFDCEPPHGNDVAGIAWA